MSEKSKEYNLSDRIRKVREVRGWKQTAVAISMNITQQAYSCLEKKGRVRLETLIRFCEVMEIEASFLLSNLPVNEETIEQYGNLLYSEISERLKKAEVYQMLLKDFLGNKQV